MTTHEEIMYFIKQVRDSFPDAAIIYTHGACYGMYTILKAVFPEAICCITVDTEHIITRIGDREYDISGEYVNCAGDMRQACKRLTKHQHEYWSSVACGQRVEYMLAKYNR